MVEADSHFKLLPTSFLDIGIDKIFEHIHMPSMAMGIGQQLQTVIPTPTQTFLDEILGLWVTGHLWSQNDVIMSWLRLAAISTCFTHPSET